MTPQHSLRRQRIDQIYHLDKYIIEIFLKNMNTLPKLKKVTYYKWIAVLVWSETGPLHLAFRTGTSKSWPFDITRKDVFAFRFILNDNILFWSYISYQKPFVLNVSVFCSQICYPKIKFTAKDWSDLCKFYSKVIVFLLVSKKIFFNISLLNLNYWCFTTVMWKFQKFK